MCEVKNFVIYDIDDFNECSLKDFKCAFNLFKFNDIVLLKTFLEHNTCDMLIVRKDFIISSFNLSKVLYVVDSFDKLNQCKLYFNNEYWSSIDKKLNSFGFMKGYKGYYFFSLIILELLKNHNNKLDTIYNKISLVEKVDKENIIKNINSMIKASILTSAKFRYFFSSSKKITPKEVIFKSYFNLIAC